MTSDPTHLLRQLQPAVLPAYAAAPPSAPAAPLEQRPFDELLAEAGRGRVESGRPVSAGAEAALTRQQLDRVASAADLAEASGATRALMLVDGRGFVLDVPSRTLGPELSADRSPRLVNLDAAMYVAGGDRATAVVPPPGGAPHRGVAEAIESGRRPDQP